MSEGSEKQVRVAVHPPAELQVRRRLLGALEGAYPVSFVPHQASPEAPPDAVLVVGRELPAELPAGVPVLRALAEESAGAKLTLELSGALDRPLRGAVLSDSFAGPIADLPGEPHSVLARADGRPAWVEQAPGQMLVASMPAELGPDEPLRARLAPGRCLALLALLHLIRSVLGDRDPDAGELRAAFVFDDPNLHWPTYGHVHYGRLAAHAGEHGYHAVIAMVPLDGWLAHPGVIRTFAGHPEQLSICVHGNDHLGPELGRIADRDAGIALAARAIRRSAAFELRTGLPVDPVMVPPHEELSEPAARGLMTAGYEAVCVSRPYPWIRPIAPFAAPSGRGTLSGWGSREILEGGLPVLLRAGFNAPLEDLVLRAYLGQPLILYGHHDLLADGPEPLARAARAINALGDVRWGSLASIARAGVRTRRRDSLLDVEMLTRRAILDVPEGVHELRLDHRALGDSSAGASLSSVGAASAPRASGVEGISLVEVSSAGPVELRIELPQADFVESAARTALPAVIRRLASEARDRVGALQRGRRGCWGLPS